MKLFLNWLEYNEYSNVKYKKAINIISSEMRNKNIDLIDGLDRIDLMISYIE